jgi:hypothetical protein
MILLLQSEGCDDLHCGLLRMNCLSPSLSLLSRALTHLRIVHSEPYPNLKAEDKHVMEGQITPWARPLIASAPSAP